MGEGALWHVVPLAMYLKQTHPVIPQEYIDFLKSIGITPGTKLIEYTDEQSDALKGFLKAHGQGEYFFD